MWKINPIYNEWLISDIVGFPLQRGGWLTDLRKLGLYNVIRSYCLLSAFDLHFVKEQSWEYNSKGCLFIVLWFFRVQQVPLEDSNL